MVTEKIKKLQSLQAQANELQSAIESERNAELADLPARYGFDSLPDFIKAVKSAVEGKAPAKRRGRKPGRPAAVKAAKPAKVAKAAKPGRPAKGGKRTRARITPEIKQQVRAAVESGKSGAAIAEEFGISVPSVQNIKKEFGMVKARK